MLERSEASQGGVKIRHLTLFALDSIIITTTNPDSQSLDLSLKEYP
jgi:hypothetical protein